VYVLLSLFCTRCRQPGCLRLPSAGWKWCSRESHRQSHGAPCLSRCGEVGLRWECGDDVDDGEV
jgi:hypothetical protein